MAASQENLDDTSGAHEAASADQSPLACDEVSSLHTTKSSSVRPSTGGLYQGPHDWRNRLRPVANPDRLGNCTGDRKPKSPDGSRQKDLPADVSNILYDRSVILLHVSCSNTQFST